MIEAVPTSGEEVLGAGGVLPVAVAGAAGVGRDAEDGRLPHRQLVQQRPRRRARAYLQRRGPVGKHGEVLLTGGDLNQVRCSRIS